MLTESASLSVSSTSSVIKPALSFQTIKPGLPPLPLVKPVQLALKVPISLTLAALEFILPIFKSDLPVTIEFDLPIIIAL